MLLYSHCVVQHGFECVDVCTESLIAYINVCECVWMYTQCTCTLAQPCTHQQHTTQIAPHCITPYHTHTHPTHTPTTHTPHTHLPTHTPTHTPRHTCTHTHHTLCICASKRTDQCWDLKNTSIMITRSWHSVVVS